MRQLIGSLYDIGTDAVIIQDMGILEMDLPPIPLFASTQTHNYSPEKVKFLENAGIQRVILARELSLEQISRIRENTSVELEAFVHGALCVSYSGQCYFSYSSSKRSANRGECAQPCRMLYSLEDSTGKTVVKDKYLLSLKDLNLSDYLRQLIDAGITSFKIEGRLKDISYVKNITAYYRQKLDKIIGQDGSLEKSSSGRVSPGFTPDPNKTFSRGYTSYFIEGRTHGMSSFNSQKSTGEYTGRVKSVSGNSVVIDTTLKLQNGDGICFLDKNNILQGINVNRVEGSTLHLRELKGIYPGAEIYRNHEHAFLKELKQDDSGRQIGVSLNAEMKDHNILITAADEDGVSVSRAYELQDIPAENPERMIETLKKQMLRSGDSIFYVKDVSATADKVIFIPVGRINEIRRNILQVLETERDSLYVRNSDKITPNEEPFIKKSLDHRGNVVNRLARQFYRRHQVENIEDGFELRTDIRDLVIMTCRYCIKKELNMCPKDQTSRTDKTLREPLYLKDRKNTYRLSFDCARCEMSVISPSTRTNAG